MKSAVVGVVLSDDRKQILVLKRRDVPMWVLPGGGIEEGESPEEAVKREILEETGLHVQIVRKVAEYSPLNKLARYTYLFECKPLSGELSTGDETLEIGFYPVNKIPKEFFIIHQDWLKDTLSNFLGVIRKPLSQITYFKLFKYFMRHPIQVIRLALSRFGFPINKK
jgi:8-oxo-dGTP diphosphatase